MALKLKSAYETEVYISKGGYLTISQEDPSQQETHYTQLTPEQAELVVKEMLELLKTKAEWWKVTEDQKD